MDLSVVIPVKNEAGNIAPLAGEIVAALNGIAEYEIVYVDDGSDDSTVAEIRRLQAALPLLRLIRHARSYGQSAAIRSGVKAARGSWIATLDGDGQNDPADIPALWRIARGMPAGVSSGLSGPASGDRHEARLLIIGHRGRRQDSWSKRRASLVANAVRRRLLRDDTPDTGCGLKLFPRALFLDLPYFDHMHRFLPALVLREGGVVRSVPVNHRPRQRGFSKYGVLDRLGVGIVDLFGVMWLRRRIAIPEYIEAVAALPETSVPMPTQKLRAARPEPVRDEGGGGAGGAGSAGSPGTQPQSGWQAPPRRRCGIGAVSLIRWRSPRCSPEIRLRRSDLSRCTSRQVCSLFRALCWRSPPGWCSAGGGDRSGRRSAAWRARSPGMSLRATCIRDLSSAPIRPGSGRC